MAWAIIPNVGIVSQLTGEVIQYWELFYMEQLGRLSPGTFARLEQLQHEMLQAMRYVEPSGKKIAIEALKDFGKVASRTLLRLAGPAITSITAVLSSPVTLTILTAAGIMLLAWALEDSEFDFIFAGLPDQDQFYRVRIQAKSLVPQRKKRKRFKGNELLRELGKIWYGLNSYDRVAFQFAAFMKGLTPYQWFIKTSFEGLKYGNKPFFTNAFLVGDNEEVTVNLFTTTSRAIIWNWVNVPEGTNMLYSRYVVSSVIEEVEAFAPNTGVRIGFGELAPGGTWDIPTATETLEHFGDFAQQVLRLTTIPTQKMRDDGIAAFFIDCRNFRGYTRINKMLGMTDMRVQTPNWNFIYGSNGYNYFTNNTALIHWPPDIGDQPVP